MFIYSRMAPLASTHLLARVALTGWDQNRASGAPAASSTRLVAGRRKGLQRKRPWTRARAPASLSTQLGQRLAAAESHIEELRRWRATFVHSLPTTPAAPVASPRDAVPECWETKKAYFPYVVSIREKTHKVAVGYPQQPRDWRTECGWAFGVSINAKPVLSLPDCH